MFGEAESGGMALDPSWERHSPPTGQPRIPDGSSGFNRGNGCFGRDHFEYVWKAALLFRHSSCKKKPVTTSKGAA
eukprot:4565737-Pyramimonas_sp.AAC.2